MKYNRPNNLSWLKSIANKINLLIKKGTWELLSSIEQAKYIQDLNYYFVRVSKKGSKRALSRMLGIAFTFLSGSSFGQSFGSEQINPFGIQNSGTFLHRPSFVDIDSDGDLDYFNNSDSLILFQENNGSPAIASFGQVQINPFSIQTTEYISAIPSFIDIDNDGDLDLFCWAVYGDTYIHSFEFYENTGTVSAPTFAAPVSNPFGLVMGNLMMGLTFVDIDADGDFDVFTSNYNNIGPRFFENTGSATIPSFTNPISSPFGIVNPSSNNLILPSFADIDNDGDFDFFTTYHDYATSENNLVYQENIGSSSMPSFSSIQLNPFDVQLSYSYFPMVSFADIDADGDQDLFIAAYEDANGNQGPVYFHEQSSGVTSIEENKLININLYPNPSSLNLINVQLPQDGKEYSISVYGVDGALISILNNQKSYSEVPLDGFSKGSYFIEVSDADFNKTRKVFMKQ